MNDKFDIENFKKELEALSPEKREAFKLIDAGFMFLAKREEKNEQSGKIFSCPKCGSVNVFMETKGTHTGLYCGDCGNLLSGLAKTKSDW